MPAYSSFRAKSKGIPRCWGRRRRAVFRAWLGIRTIPTTSSMGSPGCLARDSYHPDYVVDGVTGLLASSDGQLSEALDGLIQEPKVTARMSAAAIKHAGKFDWDRITEQWQELLELAVVSHSTSQGKRVSRIA